MMDQDGESGWLELSATSIVVYSFFQSSFKCAHTPELDALGEQLWAPKQQVESDDLDDGDLQTDGNRCGRQQNREPVANEEVFQRIGAQLAELGDQLNAEIEPSLVNHLVQQFMAGEELTRHLSQAVEKLVNRMPEGIEKEKAMLVTAMVLARNVASTVPSLLQRVFSTTVNYINQNLQDYVNNLPRDR